eukprot:s11075_g1.t1
MPGQPDDDAAAGTSQAGTGNMASVGVPASAWSNLDAVDLAAEFGTPVPTMQSVPVFLRHGVRLALRALREAYARGTALQQTRAWKLFLLLPRLLLHRAREPGNVGRETLVQRARDFLAGRWATPCSLPRARPLARRTLDETPMPPTTTLARGAGQFASRALNVLPTRDDVAIPSAQCQGWQHHGARSCSTHFRETELLPALQPPAQAMLRSRRPDHTPPAWLSAVPGEAGSALPPDRMLIALRRRHGCPCLSHRTDVARTATDAALTLTPTVTTMPRAPELGCSPDELSPSSTHGCTLSLTGPYGATPLGEAPCCDVTLVSPLTREGRPQPSAASRDGAAIAVAERRKRAAYPELLRPGPQRLCVLACEAGGRWSAESLRLVTQLARLRAQRAPAALRGVAKQGWLRRWWGLLSTLAATLLGAPYVHGAMPGARLPALEEVLHDAAPPTPSLLGL